MSRYKFFVAGTDTDVGKTFVSQALLEAAKLQGLSCYGLKPVAAGCEQSEDGLKNDDALKLIDSASVKLSYQQVNPIALELAVAPHIAAKQAGISLTLQKVVGFCRGAMMNRADFVLIEGAGGWRVPLNNRETLAQIPKELALPVILVVGIKLGCINHAILTVEAIARDGVKLAGWVANYVDPEMQMKQDSVATLKQAINAPLIGEIPFIVNECKNKAASYLQIAEIL
ncbi:MAG: dethiobiotin synthase [Oceanospirillaceae bacterium]